MKSLPKFKTVVAFLEGEKNLFGLVGLLEMYLVFDNIMDAYMDGRRLESVCDDFVGGETSRVGRRIDAIVKAIDRLPVHDEVDRDRVLEPLLKYAAYVGDGPNEIEAMVERVKRKPIVPKLEAA